MSFTSPHLQECVTAVRSGAHVLLEGLLGDEVICDGEILDEDFALASVMRSRAEIDLVLELPGQQRWAVEIKRSSAPTISKGFHLGAEDIGATHKWVVYGGSETYPLGEGIKAVPLEQLQAVLRGMV